LSGCTTGGLSSSAELHEVRKKEVEKIREGKAKGGKKQETNEE
jgi:hypothetical protein